MIRRALGVCYYPEHWPEDVVGRGRRAAWPPPASPGSASASSPGRRLEPAPGDSASTGSTARSTPSAPPASRSCSARRPRRRRAGCSTATPTCWPWDREGRPRGLRLAPALRLQPPRLPRGVRAHRPHPRRALRRATRTSPAWQTDNEYGCHDTALSYSPVAAAALPRLARREIRRRRRAERGLGQRVLVDGVQRASTQIDLPNLTVTEANPAHWLDFRRFSSDQVVAFNRVQTEAIRAHSRRADPAQLHGPDHRVRPFRHRRATSTSPPGTATRSASSRTAPTRARPGRPRSSARATPTSRRSTTTSTARSAAAAGG